MANKIVSHTFVAAGTLCIAALTAAPRHAKAQTAQPHVQYEVIDAQGLLRKLADSSRLVIDNGNRAVLGTTLGVPAPADTLGLLGDDVTTDGPAARAGITRGARITAINGVNVRVSRADADDEDLLGISQRRLQREVGKAKPGDEVEERVWEHGQTRTVRVTTVTLGLFISSVVRSGPAEKAGVFEGDRVAAINGADVRVPKGDAEDTQASRV